MKRKQGHAWDMWPSLEGMDDVVSESEAYAGSSSNGTGEDVALSTSRVDARRTVMKVDGIILEVILLLLMREDCPLSLASIMMYDI